ncbi:hypothetical protein O181_094189 [Austropuccinia psidii MF-1]|uniref:Uncharacterized protein n=1 Tax=Austropuccinia psidii MF-1 TaxID=1389203 RepID=A0A9Q3J2P4_9BASI|nr:hypothetical protein [Austropuccinia psidii MF-1]
MQSKIQQSSCDTSPPTEYYVTEKEGCAQEKSSAKIKSPHTCKENPRISHHNVFTKRQSCDEWRPCSEELSPNLKSPDPCKKVPHQNQSHMMESRGIQVEKDSSHGVPPGLPKGINRGALSPKIQIPPMHIISPAQ